MTCKKCGYQDQNEKKMFKSPLCSFCIVFAPHTVAEFQEYINEKVDWKTLEPYRKYSRTQGQRQKKGMKEKAAIGVPMSRAPFGYTVENGGLTPNEDAVKVHSLFTTFINRKYTLTSLAKNFGLSVNGLKKVLSNRTYLGEIKFDNRIHKGFHKAILAPEVFYAAQRKLKTYLRPRKK